MINEYIKELISNNSRVIIPDFGAFMIQNSDNGKIISFNDFLKFNDGVLVNKIIVNEHILELESKYDPMFTVEVVNNKVVSGVPFRDAYKEVGIAVQEGRFKFDKPTSASQLAHTHEGSIGNLCTEEIKKKMDKASKW